MPNLHISLEDPGAYPVIKPGAGKFTNNWPVVKPPVASGIIIVGAIRLSMCQDSTFHFTEVFHDKQQAL